MLCAPCFWVDIAKMYLSQRNYNDTIRFVKTFFRVMPLWQKEFPRHGACNKTGVDKLPDTE